VIVRNKKPVTHRREHPDLVTGSREIRTDRGLHLADDLKAVSHHVTLPGGELAYSRDGGHHKAGEPGRDRLVRPLPGELGCLPMPSLVFADRPVLDRHDGQ
jgi:hypothetical protein